MKTIKKLESLKSNKLDTKKMNELNGGRPPYTTQYAMTQSYSPVGFVDASDGTSYPFSSELDAV